MKGVISVPKSKHILEFLQELNGQEDRLKDAWIFVRNDVVEKLYREADEVFPKAHYNTQTTFAFFHEVEDRMVSAIVLKHEPTHNSNHMPLWSMITSIRALEDSPISVAFTYPALLPEESIFLITEE